MIAVGQTIGNYTITAKLGEGGMGVVYLAEHPVIGRKVAMKAIHPELSRNPEVVSRFVTEAKAVNQIGNEHIVDIHDFGTTPDGEFYFVMEFLQGEALSDRLKREPVMPIGRALHIAAQVADALASSHAHGIIHRDLKPENIFLITKGSHTDFVKVLDFGLAKLTQGEEKVTHKTRTGSVMGTPYYMSPEQCEGKANIDHRADLYSLGVILFEMLTGTVPFGGDGYGEIIVKHITQPPPSPRSIIPTLSLAHEAVVLRALAKHRDDRFSNMSDFRAAMLDPDGYFAGAPAVSFAAGPPSAGIAPVSPASKGALPAALADSGVSGQVVFGAPAPVAAPPRDMGHRHQPMPSTFRHGAGELLDDEISVPKSRRALIVGAVVAALAAGGAAVAVGVKRDDPQPEKAAAVTVPAPAPTTASPPTTPPPAAAAAAEKITIRFRSEPAGAEVVRKDDGKTLGTTPFELEMTPGKAAVELVFRKSGFEEKTLSMTPDESATLEARLAEAAPARPARPTTARPARPPAKPASRPPRKPASKPVDEDGVLAPSFLK